tara:strand:+ start:779 stop:1969 length:1191 start_codon:yes stop_codon:yes gene_type:complete
LKTNIDFSRPDFVFMLVWIFPLILLQFFEMSFFLQIEKITYLLIIGNIISFYLIYSFTKRVVKNKRINKIDNIFHDISKIKNFIKFLFIIWGFFYLISILYSNGLPLFWILYGSSLSYVDFGIPTITGFLNMIRAFMSVLALIIWFKTKEKKYFLLIFFLLVSAFIFEASRGNGLVLLLHIVGCYFLFFRFGKLQIFKLSISILLLILFLGIIEQYRYLRTESYNIEEKYEDIEFLNSSFGSLRLYAIPAILYVTTPVQNLNYSLIDQRPAVNYPYHSIQSLVPTFIRSKIFSENEKDYGDLLSEAYNTTSHYTPLIRDFGVFISFIITIIIQIIVSIFHIKSKFSNSKFHFLTYPALFMSVVLTPFNLFFTSLVVVFYPILSYLFINYKKIILRI